MKIPRNKSAKQIRAKQSRHKQRRKFKTACYRNYLDSSRASAGRPKSASAPQVVAPAADGAPVSSSSKTE